MSEEEDFNIPLKKVVQKWKCRLTGGETIWYDDGTSTRNADFPPGSPFSLSSRYQYWLDVIEKEKDERKQPLF